MQYIFNFAAIKFILMTLDTQAVNLEKLLERNLKTAIISHFNPDGDAIGSAVGMYAYLRSKGQEPRIVMPSYGPECMDFLDPDKEITYFTRDKETAETVIRGSGLIICLDLNKTARTEQLAGLIAGSDAVKVMIDHHPSPETDGFSIVISDPGASSTCELLYRILMSFRSTGGCPEKLGLRTLTSLATGILTDTNNFNNSLTPYTFTAASEMLRAGVDFDFITNMVFRRYSEDRMRLMGHLLTNSMQIDRSLRASCMVMTLEDRRRFNFRDGDSEGFVNLPLMIGDVEISALFSQTEEFIRVSLRSKGNISVNAMAGRYFNGGGHERAAGGRLYMPVDQVRDYFFQSLEQFLQSSQQL